MPWVVKLTDPALVAEVVARYRAGATPKALEEVAGIGESAIRRLLKREGVVLRTHHEVRVQHTLDTTVFNTHPHAPYWVGLLLTDGHVRKDPRRLNSYGVCLSVQRRDAHIVDEFREFLGYSGAVGLTPTYASLQVASKSLFDDLGRLGVTPHKTQQGKAPEDLCHDPLFWRGVIDGDGSIWVQNNNPRVSLCSASETLVEQFKAFCGSIHVSRATVRATRTPKGLPFYVFTCSGPAARAVLTQVYTPPGPSLVRKRDKAYQIFQGGHDAMDRC